MAGSANVYPEDASVVVALGVSLIGGAYVAKVAMEQLFVHGLTDDERRGIFLAGASAAALMAAKEFFGIDQDTVMKKIADTVGGA